MIEKACQQIILEQQFLSYLYLQNQEENNQNPKDNLIPQNLNNVVFYELQPQYEQKNHNYENKQSSLLQADYIQKYVIFIKPNKSFQQKQFQKDHLNMEHILQQLTYSNILKTTKIQIQLLNQQIQIDLTQAERNVLLNLIKQKKKAQIQELITSVVCRQCHIFKQNTHVSNKLSSQNSSPKYEEQYTNLIKESYLAQNVDSLQTRKQIQRVNQFIPFVGRHSQILNEFKLLGGGCGSQKLKIPKHKVLKEDDQQKLKSDNIFNEIKYAEESQFGDFMEIYNKYYTYTEINHQVLENRIRTIVEALHKQCEHIFSLTIRYKAIELKNQLINYNMIAIQKNDIQTLQKFIDKTDQELKDQKETCFQNRKKYLCLDLYQYFKILICLNQQRQGIYKINKSQVLKAAEIILKLVKFGAGFTSIFGAIDTLSKMQLDEIKQHFKEIKQVCAKLFESSSEVGQQVLEQNASYSTGKFTSKIQAIWLKKFNRLERILEMKINKQFSTQKKQMKYKIKEVKKFFFLLICNQIICCKKSKKTIIQIHFPNYQKRLNRKIQFLISQITCNFKPIQLHYLKMHKNYQMIW
ncbi:hypothetical protein ABPG72_013294 [Tetrahymena utriculariae]